LIGEIHKTYKRRIEMGLGDCEVFAGDLAGLGGGRRPKKEKGFQTASRN